MPIIPILKNMALKPVVVVVGVALAKPLVKCIRCRPLSCSYFCTEMCQGRVAAGAIAERYLKIAHGIEIVAFVSSVGKIHLQDALASPSLASNKQEDNDEAEDAISPEFRQLIASVTREEVDQYSTRCPHLSTSERMSQVR